MGPKSIQKNLKMKQKKLNRKKCSALVPHGGFEPPQSEPESDVLPLHKRGMGEFNIHFFGVSVNAVGKEINYHRPPHSRQLQFCGKHKTGVHVYVM